MRWAVLYARSRQVPAAFVALMVCTFGLWFMARDWWSLFPAAMALTAGIAVAAIGLSGQDVDLDRTAAIPWPVRRFGHILLIGMLAGGAVLVAQALGVSFVDISLVVRAGAGLLGLAGIAAVLAGGQFGWTLPLAWFAVATFAPPGTGTASQVVRWMLQPPDTPTATWTAAVLGVGGVLAYAGWGGRR